MPYRWKQNFRNEYESNIESIKTQLVNIYDTLQEQNSTPCITKNSVVQLSSIIREASRKCSMYLTHTWQGRKADMQWHDKECKTYRNTFLRAKRKKKNEETQNHPDTQCTTSCTNYIQQMLQIKKLFMKNRL